MTAEKDSMNDERRRYTALVSVKVPWALRDELEKVSLFEHRKLAELIREWLGDRMLAYQRRPDYKRFLTLYEDKRQKRMLGRS